MRTLPLPSIKRTGKGEAVELSAVRVLNVSSLDTVTLVADMVVGEKLVAVRFVIVALTAVTVVKPAERSDNSSMVRLAVENPRMFLLMLLYIYITNIYIFLILSDIKKLYKVKNEDILKLYIKR